jgi:transposase InsO family protein
MGHLYINSDQGSQFTSDEYTEYVKSLKETEISMDGKGRATDNAHIERFFRTKNMINCTWHQVPTAIICISNALSL